MNEKVKIKPAIAKKIIKNILLGITQLEDPEEALRDAKRIADSLPGNDPEKELLLKAILMEEDQIIIADTAEDLLNDGFADEKSLVELISNTHPEGGLAERHEIEREAHNYILCAAFKLAADLPL